MAEDIVNLPLQPLGELLKNDIQLQISLIFLIAGIIAIVLINRKVSSIIDSKKFSYTRPFATEFVKKILLPLFATALIVSVSAYIQVFELFDTQTAIDAAVADAELTPRELFAKILDTFVILVIGYTIAHLIPILLANNEAKKMEKYDYQEWIHQRGFSDDKANLFHQLFEWDTSKTWTF